MINRTYFGLNSKDPSKSPNAYFWQFENLFLSNQIRQHHLSRASRVRTARGENELGIAPLESNHARRNQLTIATYLWSLTYRHLPIAYAQLNDRILRTSSYVLISFTHSQSDSILFYLPGLELSDSFTRVVSLVHIS